ncbi:helix-turn-helix domain-containing protein [Oligoflexus sp.]|uniref:helix-turn-helix domain-containing protein n=1 Tax=Oligoflexus sp. TaxID=1971216 RepID=UPI0039C93C9B
MVEQFEKSLILAALKRHKSIVQCCEALNIPRSTFVDKRRKYDLTCAVFPGTVLAIF